jgi:hypothetical protein
MSETKKIQDFIAALYTSEELRVRFLAQPESTAEEAGLSPVFGKQLAEEQGEALQFFSQTLFFKRFGVLKKLLPRLSEILGEERSSSFFKAYHDTYTLPSVARRYEEDAYNFTHFLLRSDFNFSDLEKEELRFLRLKTATWRQPQRDFFALRFFRFRLHRAEKNKGLSILLYVRFFGKVWVDRFLF